MAVYHEDLKPRELLVLRGVVIESMGRLVAASSAWDVATKKRGNKTLHNLKRQLRDIEVALNMSELSRRRR